MSDNAVTHNEAGKPATTKSSVGNTTERARAGRTAPGQTRSRPSWRDTFAFPAYSGLLEIV